MIDRIDVERLLQACEQRADIKVPAGPMLAELCRTWLAVQDAPSGYVGAVELEHAEYCAEIWTGADTAELAGQRVRLVRDGGE